MARFPKHIGIIPDGNRRWAQAKGLRKEDGYMHGLTAGVRMLRSAADRGIRELTYYGFTVDNCKRPKEQVMAFSRACVAAALGDALGKVTEKEKEMLPYNATGLM